MSVISGLISIGSTVACCAVLFALICVALVLWYWKNQPNQVTTDIAPQPPIQATIAHPDAATDLTQPAAPVAPPAPVDLSAPAPMPAETPAPAEAPAPDAAPAPAPEVPTDTPETP
jgi:hypothetical protein